MKGFANEKSQVSNNIQVFTKNTERNKKSNNPQACLHLSACEAIQMEISYDSTAILFNLLPFGLPTYQVDLEMIFKNIWMVHISKTSYEL